MKIGEKKQILYDIDHIQEVTVNILTAEKEANSRYQLS
jgi:hypothetical protein